MLNYCWIYNKNLEEAARIFCITKAIGNPNILSNDEIEQAVKIFENYIH